MREDREKPEPERGESAGGLHPKVVLPIRLRADGELELDMAAVARMAKEYESTPSLENVAGKFILAIYDTGFEAGMEAAAKQQAQAAMLMMHTAGNA